jgi:enoyl-[acyl-carrier protein] reductase II
VEKNRICRLIGIDFPLLQGGMLWLACAELAAAVSNAGALGTVSPYAGMAKEGDPVANFERQIRRAQKLTAKPVAVNVPLDLPLSGVLLDLAVSLGAHIVITASGSPVKYTEWLKKKGIIVLHVIGSVEQAIKAQAASVDAVVAQGSEAGGRHVLGALPLSLLLSQVADAVSIPVVASGGIADGRGIAAAFALGASGVQMGTCFIATKECIAHASLKQAIVAAGHDGTVVIRDGISSTRMLRSAYADRLLALENAGASPDQFRVARGFRNSWHAQLAGELDKGEAHCGVSAGYVRDIMPAATVVERLKREFVEVVRS